MAWDLETGRKAYAAISIEPAELSKLCDDSADESLSRVDTETFDSWIEDLLSTWPPAKRVYVFQISHGEETILGEDPRTLREVRTFLPTDGVDAALTEEAISHWLRPPTSERP